MIKMINKRVIEKIKNGGIAQTTINKSWYRVWYGEHINPLIGKTVHVEPMGLVGSTAYSFPFPNTEHYEKGGKTYRLAVDFALEVEVGLALDVYEHLIAIEVEKAVKNEQ